MKRDEAIGVASDETGIIGRRVIIFPLRRRSLGLREMKRGISCKIRRRSHLKILRRSVPCRSLQIGFFRFCGDAVRFCAR